MIKTTANMINGTYTVTVKAGEETASGNAEVTSQRVEEIQILNTVALTVAEEDISTTSDGKADDGTGVLVYYDVVDQYGESMRNSTTIEWSSSCKVKKNDKTNGVLTLIRTDDKAFTYGESVYVTGVHAKTGKSISATLTVGAKQALNDVKVEGFVKKGTSEILKSLPCGFKSQEYYLVYSVLDQNGNKMTARKFMGSDPDTEAEVTFISDSILVIKEITKTNETVLTLNGVEYCAAFVEPGIDVNKGGEVNITAIANKTGNKSNFNVSVGNNQILKSFTLLEPSGTIADGESATIPFTALDQNGDEIKNFVTLASQSDFNRLQLNASTGRFVLSENDDGTASLTWYDNEDSARLWNSNSEDGIDRPISLTAVVVGGETSNEMIYVQDKAMPVAIKSADLNPVYVQRSTADITLSSFTFIDQYNREMGSYGDGAWGSRPVGYPDYKTTDANTGNANKGCVKDNGFFAYVNSASNALSGSEYNGKSFGVTVEFKGQDENLENKADGWNKGYATITSGAIGLNVKHIGTADVAHFVSGASFTITSGANFKVCADQTLKFTISKISDSLTGSDVTDSKYDDVSPIFYHAFKGVNIDRVSGFEIGDLNTFYVNTAISGKINGAVAGLTKDNITSSAGIDILTAGGIGIGDRTDGADVSTKTTTNKPYYQQVKVTGKYNGVTVDVPADYFTVAGSKLGVDLDAYDKVSTGALNNDVIDSVAVSTGALSATDLYDANSAQFLRKLAEDTLKVTVYKASGTAIIATDSCIVNTATKKVAISDAAPYAATICAEDAYTISPNITTITGAASPNDLLRRADYTSYQNTYYVSGNYWKVLDQYGVEMNHSKINYAYKITDVKENADRYADNNFATNKNDTKDATIKGAENGDTFLLTISADGAKKDIKITVGADSWSFIDDAVNAYAEYLVDKDGKNASRTPVKPDGLEKQRVDSLGSN